MIKKRRWLWFLLFISVALLLGALATGWNVVLVRDYQRFVALAKTFSLPQDIGIGPTPLIIKMILGTLGFIAALGLTLMIFARLLNEMRLNQIQSEFLATVSHELKTPIASIELASSMLRAGGLSESEKVKLWNSHQIELVRLKEEVETLLEAARWQSRPPLYRRDRVLIEDWILQSFSQWKEILGPEAVLIREGEPLTLFAKVDLRSMNLIACNLLNNAKKFSRGPAQVMIRTSRVHSKTLFSRSRWRIQFEDKGWGFNPADSKRIFHRFFRSRTLAPYAIPGTGLGLYLAQSASKAMGLTLVGESIGKGKGATFTLEGQECTSPRRSP